MSMDRPSVPRTLKPLGRPISVHTIEESLRKFDTIAFGIELMHERIRPSRSNPDAVDIGPWFSLVPDAYEEDVLYVVQRVAAEHVRASAKLTAESLYQLVCEFNSGIWRWVPAFDIIVDRAPIQ